MNDIKINFELLTRLAERDHPLANIKAEHQDLPQGVGEALQNARVAHHLLDLGGIPRGREGSGLSSDLDARTYLAVAELSDIRLRLGRIADQHVREADPPTGAFSEICRECAQLWPCYSWRLAEGKRLESPES